MRKRERERKRERDRERKRERERECEKQRMSRVSVSIGREREIDNVKNREKERVSECEAQGERVWVCVDKIWNCCSIYYSEWVSTKIWGITLKRIFPFSVAFDRLEFPPIFDFFVKPFPGKRIKKNAPI